MSVFSDITALRKGGRIEEAYEMAKKALAENPDDIWAKRALAWVLYEFIDRNASVENREKMFSYLTEFGGLDLPADEEMVFSSVLWCLRKFYANCGGLQFDDCNFYDQLFDAYKGLPFPKSDAYFALLRAVLANKKNWERSQMFIEWWGVENFREEDFEPFVMQNGRSLLSLAERCYIDLSKYYEADGSADNISAFTDRLRDVACKYPKLTYIPYYLAKLLIKQEKYEEAIVALKPFVKSKPKDFWVWQLMAEAHSEDEDKLAFYCKALECGGKDEMLVGVRESAALLFAKLGFCKEAKYEIDKVIATKEKNNWRISASILNIRNLPWYKTSETLKTNCPFYKMYSDRAEGVVFGERKKFKVLATFVNAKNGYISFVTEDKQSGFFKNTNKRIIVKAGDVLELEAVELETDKPSSVKRFAVAQDDENTNFFRKFEGKVRKNPQSGFAIVSGVFVSSGLLKGVADNELVNGKAMISFDKKKSKWGWTAVSVSLKP